MFVKYVKQAYRNYYSRPRKNIRVSDLYGDCTRKSVYAKLDPFPPNEEDMHRFMVGQAVHEKIQDMISKEYPARFTIEKEVTYKVDNYITVFGHIDVVDEVDGYVVDIKTRYVLPGQIEKDTIKEYELQQLKWYMAIVNKPGVLARFFINAKSKDNELELFGWKEDIIEFKSDLERQYHLQTLGAKAQNYSLALNMKDPKIAMNILDDSTKNKYCGSCPWADKCWKLNHG